MSEYSFKLPDLGEGSVESEISAWHIAVGDRVEEDQVIAEVQTDKAVVDVGSPVTGVVLALGCAAGEMLAVGAELVRFDTGAASNKARNTVVSLIDTAPKPEQREAPRSSKPAVQAASAKRVSVPDVANPLALDSTGTGLAPATRVHSQPEAERTFSQVLASPSLRRRAREEGIDLAQVPGSGPGGRISHDDLESFLASGASDAIRGAGPGGAQVAQGGAVDQVTEIPITGLRRVIARKMQATKRNIPHYSYVEEVDVTELEATRRFLNDQRQESQPKLTLLPFLIRALIRALPEFPHCNARYDDEGETLLQYAAVHVGIATMTPQGLMVPVLANAQELDVWEMASQIADLAERARNGRCTPAELGGSTITITSLGAIGGVVSTPVINAPETAIIGVNKMQRRPVVRGEQIVPRTMMNLSASFDHRIVDGFDGANLVQEIRQLLEHPSALFV
ncbi:MAG: dihydrolipoamide acetyltransferase family protein [Pseudomonadota bacterium]